MNQVFDQALHPSFGFRQSRPRAKLGLFWSTDGVADGGANAKQTVGREVIGVVQDVVVMDLRTHKDMSPHVVTNSGTHIDEEMVAADKIVAGETVGAIRHIEAGALPADATHQIQADLLADAGLIQAVEVSENGAKGLSARSAVRALAAFPGSFKVESYALVEDHVGADGGIKASLFRADEEAGTIDVAGSGGHECASAEHRIALLSRGELGQEQESQKRCEDR